MQKLKDYEAMKGITILLVVFAHVTRMYSPQGVVPIGYSRPLEMFTNFVYIFHMPAFVAITGAIYYFLKRERGKYTDHKRFVLNKLQRLLVPFIFFSLFIVLPVLFYLGIKDNVWLFVLKEVVLGISSTHLWYSVMIFVVFVFFNRFENRVYEASGLLKWTLFVLCNIFSFVIPNVFQIANALKYSIFFYLGYWFQRNKSKAYPKLKSLALPFFLVTLASCFILFHTPVESMFLMTKVVQLIGGVTGTAVLYVASDRLSDSRISSWTAFEVVAEYSYGIFLFHPMIVYLLSYAVQGTEFSSYLVTFLIFSLALILSLTSVNVMRKYKLQLFIGEKPEKRAREPRVLMKN